MDHQRIRSHLTVASIMQSSSKQVAQRTQAIGSGHPLAVDAIAAYPRESVHVSGWTAVDARRDPVYSIPFQRPSRAESHVEGAGTGQRLPLRFPYPPPGLPAPRPELILPNFALVNTESQEEILARYEIQTCPDFMRLFTVADRLGNGSFGTVFSCTAVSATAKYAVKVPVGEGRESSWSEIKFLTALSHKNIVQAVCAFEHPQSNSVLIVLDLAERGDLYDFVRSSDYRPATDTRHVFRQLAEGLEYIHSMGIVHGDFKPGNILVFDRTNEPDHPPQVKISDFGNSKYMDLHGYIARSCTRHFCAPESYLNDGCQFLGKPADIWSLGCVLYHLLTGGHTAFVDNVPMRDRDQAINFKIHMKNGWFGWPVVSRWRISNCAKHLVNDLLWMDPQTRTSTSTALKHPWVVYGDPSISSDWTEPYLRNEFTMPKRWSLDGGDIHPSVYPNVQPQVGHSDQPAQVQPQIPSTQVPQPPAPAPAPAKALVQLPTRISIHSLLDGSEQQQQHGQPFLSQGPYRHPNHLGWGV